jgi:uncharacterized RDD family membrane protein YckC
VDQSVTQITDPMGNEARDWHGHYAGFGSRFMAYFVDAVVMIVAFYATMFIIALALALVTLERPKGVELDDLQWLLAFAAFAVTWLFYFTWVYGKTPGKALFGLRVVRKNGDRLGPIRSFIRGPAYLVDYLFFCLGFIWIMISKERRAWHDYIAGSCVVYDWDARPGARYRAARNRTRGS